MWHDKNGLAFGKRAAALRNCRLINKIEALMFNPETVLGASRKLK